MRTGSTRRWRRGQMPRARERDQRLAAGVLNFSVDLRVCIEALLFKDTTRSEECGDSRISRVRTQRRIPAIWISRIGRIFTRQRNV